MMMIIFLPVSFMLVFPPFERYNTKRFLPHPAKKVKYMNQSIKKQFPTLINNPDIVYLDSAATSLTPQAIIDATSTYYTHFNANIHRAGHTLANKATAAYEEARAKVATFINAPENKNITFTNGTTHSLNLLANGLKHIVKKGDNIVISKLEHHANYLPWQQLANETEAELRVTNSSEIISNIDKNTKIVAIIHISNVTGEILPIKNICHKAKEVGAISIIDGAQAVGHRTIDVQTIGCDAYAFSGHKMYGPTGIGALYTTTNLQKILQPYHLGGGMVDKVGDSTSTWQSAPHKFEAGTPNIAGTIGLAAAIDFINNIGLETIQNHDQELMTYLNEQLQTIPEIKILNPNNTSSVLSLTVQEIHPNDLATILNEQGIATRAGYHCAQPLMKQLGITGTLRVSLGIHNTKDDIDTFITALKKSIEILSK